MELPHFDSFLSKIDQLFDIYIRLCLLAAFLQKLPLSDISVPSVSQQAAQDPEVSDTKEECIVVYIQMVHWWLIIMPLHTQCTLIEYGGLVAHFDIFDDTHREPHTLHAIGTIV